MSLQNATLAKQGNSRFKPVQSGFLQRKCTACGTHTPGGGTCTKCADESKGLKLQKKLSIGATNDPLEAEADRVADQVLASSSSPDIGYAPPRIQRYSAQAAHEEDAAPASVHRTLDGSGAPLESGLRQDMETRFGHDFSGVRVRSNGAAAQSARDVGANAYTVGSNIVFGAGQYAPGSAAGRRLLAHELAHVVQQGVGAALPTLRRKPPLIGTRFTHPAGAKSTLKSVKGAFDGQDFSLKDGSTTILTHAAQSGKPVSVRSSDALKCGGSTADSYLNNSMYIGIKDFGAIPEGKFTFNLNSFATFSGLEQASMIAGGSFTDPLGSTMHGGDWGAGRSPLEPTKLEKAACGNTAARSGFYLHGGSLPGSSGCIDVDNDGIDDLLNKLAGYKSDIEVTVRYTKSAPSVGTGQRALGRFTYPTKNGKPIKDPGLRERLGAILETDDEAATPKAEPKHEGESGGSGKASKPNKKTHVKERKQKKKGSKKAKKTAANDLNMNSNLVALGSVEVDEALLVLQETEDSEIEGEA
jgi:hypothetical protein